MLQRECRHGGVETSRSGLLAVVLNVFEGRIQISKRDLGRQKVWWAAKVNMSILAHLYVKQIYNFWHKTPVCTERELVIVDSYCMSWLLHII